MDWIYVLISSIMSLSLIALISVPVSRIKNSSVIFSTALGIIIFRCVKSIFAECGWGFAALFGIFNGVAVQVTIFLAAFVFFHELSADDFFHGCNLKISQICMLIFFGVGKNLLYNYSELSDVMLYIFGEAADFALILFSAAAISDEFSKKCSASVISRAAALIALRAVILIACRSWEDIDRVFASLIMLTVGISGMVYEFAQAVKDGRSISAAGFAAGLTATFCFDSLMG